MKIKMKIAGFLLLTTATLMTVTGCSPKKEDVKTDPVQANIKMYTEVWDKIINEGKLELINDSSFTTNLVMHEGPVDVVGLDSVRAYYSNFITGFTNIKIHRTPLPPF